MVAQDVRVTASDATLIAQTRRGDDLAFETLVRRHQAALRDLGSLLVDDPGPLVDEALRVAYRTLRRVQGPQTWLRGYLLQLMCRIHAHRASADPDAPEPVPFLDDHQTDDYDEVAAEFAGLADAWQAALWHRDAERESAAQVATVVGVSDDRVDALVRSAEEDLRRALLTRRWNDDLPAPCRAHTRRLMTASPDAIPRAVARHAVRCAGCAHLLDDLDVVRRHLPDVLARHLLGEVGDAYLAVRRTARSSTA